MPCGSSERRTRLRLRKVKVTLLNKRNAAEALTAPLNGKAIAIDDVADLIYIVQTDKSGYTRRTT